MAHRPAGFGLTAEVRNKIKKKYDVALEQEVRCWIEDVLGEQLDPDCDRDTPLGMDRMQIALKDGVILCRVMNEIRPGSIKKINRTKMAFHQMENIGVFLEALKKYGVKETDVFQTVDLYEKQNMVAVIYGIFALGRAAQNNGFAGPVLGPKESKENPRNFSEDTLRAGETVIGLQAGSNRGASQAGMNFGKSRSILD